MKTSKRVTIFEGPDGAGKTTAALNYAERTNARYVHFGPLPHVRTSLARVYVEAMLPALLGYQDVVLDRSWLSEYPYGTTFRATQPLRVSVVENSMLERIALRCGAVVVKCLPDQNVVIENFKQRRQIEMLKNEADLKEVWLKYAWLDTDLPTIDHDYTINSLDDLFANLESLRLPTHPLCMNTAGNWYGDRVIVGDTLAEMKETDSFQQYPFVSFSQSGCSYWLTKQLVNWGTREHDICWINAADPGIRRFFEEEPDRRRVVIALGKQAASKLIELGVNHVTVPHPQYQKRFNNMQEYSLRKLMC